MPGASLGRTEVSPVDGYLPKRRITIRIEMDTLTAYVNEKTLRTWLERNAGGGYSLLVEELQTHNMLRANHRQLTLGAGSGVATGQTFVLGFDVGAPIFSGAIRAVKEDVRKLNLYQKLGVRAAVVR